MHENLKKAILIVNKDDIGLFDQSDQRARIACEYPIIELNKSIHLDYFLDDLDIGINLHDFVGDLVNNWYRDEKGIDVISKSEVSIGALLQYRLAILFSNSLRYYIAFFKCLENYEKLLIPSSCPQSLAIAANYFDERTEFYNTNNEYDDVITSAPNRGIIVNPRIKKYFSYLARLFQKPFLNQLKNKILIMNDWTYRVVDNSECLDLNTLNVLKSFYLQEGKEYFEIAEKSFPISLNKKIIAENIERVVKKYDLEDKLGEDISDLFLSILFQTYKEEREMLKIIYSSTEEMFDYYSPAMVITPGYAHPAYQAIYAIAKSRGIPSMFVLDGFPFTIDLHLFPMDKSNKEHMISHFAAMGDNVKNLYKKVLNIDEFDMLNIYPPILKKQQKQSSESPSDVIVLFPTAMPQNPLAHWDQRFKYVLDVIKVLNDLGETKIKIKTKTGYYKKTQNNEYTFLRHILDKENFNHVEIIDGELTSCLNEAKYLVGQLTTSIIESVYSGRPYYIFEPHSMGMPNRMIDECFIKNEMISRNLMDLKSSIIEKNDADFILSKNLSGELLENINFREIISSFHGYKP